MDLHGFAPQQKAISLTEQNQNLKEAKRNGFENELTCF